jgi:hypothetical protein
LLLKSAQVGPRYLNRQFSRFSVAETNVDDIVIAAVRDFEMPHTAITFIREIGSGEFGVVMEASASGLPNAGWLLSDATALSHPAAHQDTVEPSRWPSSVCETAPHGR